MEDEILEQQPSADFAARFFTLLERYRKLLIKHFWIPVLAVGIGLGTESWVLRHTPPTFVSTGRMLVSGQYTFPNTANIYHEELNNFLGTQAALMESDTVKRRVQARLLAQHPELTATPVSLTVTPGAKTSIFDLKASGTTPEYTQAYLQGVMEEYIELKKELLANAGNATQSAMQEKLRLMGTNLDACNQAILDFQTSNSVVFLPGNSAAERFSLLTRQLADARLELKKMQTLTLDQNLERMQRQLPTTGAGSLTNAGEPQLPVQYLASSNAPSNSESAQSSTPRNLGMFEDAYLNTKEQLLLLQIKWDGLINYNTNLVATSSKDLMELSNSIAVQEKLLEHFRSESEKNLINREEDLKLTIQDLESEAKAWEARAMDVSKRLAVWNALEEKRRVLQAQYDQIEANLQTLALSKSIGQETVGILEPANEAFAVPPATTKHMVMAGLMGLILAGGILALINELNDLPASFVELQRLFDLPVLGQIPRLRLKRKTGPLLQLEDTRYPMKESYRSLRSALLFKDVMNGDPKSHPKSIVITSACPNDGKSITAANFAITLAQAGARVLLIDADLRRGVLHKLFQVGDNPGMTEVLAGECPWHNAVVQTGVPNLWLMPGGDAYRYPSTNLFANSGKFMKELAGYYDYYILDTVPVMVADDVLSLAPHADGLLMVVRAGYTSGRIAQAALDQLRQRRVNVLGLVFNAIPENSSDYHHYRYKAYYK